MTDAVKSHEENKAKTEAEAKVKADKGELDSAFAVNKGTEEVKDKDGKVTTAKVEGDSQEIASLKDSYKKIGYVIVEKVPESRERFFAIDTLKQSLGWFAEAAKRS